MASKLEFSKVEVNLKGVREVLSSRAVGEELAEIAGRIADEANRQVAERAPSHGYGDAEFFKVGGPRAGERKSFATVYGTKDIAHAMQARHDVLTKSIDAGRR